MRTVAIGLRRREGFTIIEVMVASLVLLVGILGTVSLIDTANAVTNLTKAREQGVSLEREVLESARSIPYTQLDNSTIVARVQATPNLANAFAGPGWTIQRRGVTYNVALGECTVDDPTDGYGTEDPTKYCASNAAPIPSCATLLSGATSISGNSSVISGLSANLAGQLAVGSCGLDLALNGHVSNLVQADIALCAGGLCAPTPTSDATPDDYRRITVLVTWQVQGQLHYVRQAGTVTNPGGQAYGPSVSGFATSAATPIGPTYLATTVPFSLTASSDATQVVWSVNGTDAGVATQGTGNSWTFNWTIGTSGLGSEVLDGSYLVAARAVNSSGVSGAVSALTITLNRRQAYAPTGFIGGRNSSVVEFQWAANREADIAGYRVYLHPTTGSDVKVCDVPTRQTNCQDTSPPSGSPLSYYVVALDHDTSGNLREGDPSAMLLVTNTNQAPNPPTGLAASTSSGNTVLAWTAPATPDPDGDAISFYRIYRDGQAYANRYDTSTGAQTTFTDTNTGGVSHTYSVTAVDPTLAESTVVGPVTQ